MNRIDELIALAALGELSAEEQVELDAAVQADPAVAAELATALDAAAALQSVAADAPPVRLRASILDAIASTPQDEVSNTPAPVVDLGAERRRRRSVGALVAAAAAAAVFFVGAAVVVSNRDDGGTDQIAAVVGAADAESRILTGEFEMIVTYSPSEGAVVVEGEALPTLGDEETYQLWLVGDGGAATSAGIFRPDAAGTVMQRFDDVDPTGFVLGVTEEPAGGSETPSLPILASA